MTVEKVLLNGVNVFALEVENDFEEANEILEYNVYTSQVDAEYVYEERLTDKFNGTYEVMIDRQQDYLRFQEMIIEERSLESGQYYDRKREIREMYYANKIDREGLDIKYSEIEKEEDENRKLNFRIPTFEEWKEGKYNTVKPANMWEIVKEEDKKYMKLGKAMRKAGYSNQLLDFYSLQEKSDVKGYITISNRVQHIAGMSYYSNKTWDGMGKSSCQNPEGNEYEEYPKRLLGSLHDNKLWVAFLHYELEDTENFYEKVSARSVMRHIEIDGKECLVPTNYYGNNGTRNCLDRGLEQLAEMEIYGESVRNGNELGRSETIEEVANGTYTFEDDEEEEIYICETFEEEVSCECPACGGSGEYTVYSNRQDEDIDVSCPACGGDGTVTTWVSIDIDTYVTVDGGEAQEITPYYEGYTHYGYKIAISVNIEQVKALRKEVAEAIQHDKDIEEAYEINDNLNRLFNIGTTDKVAGLLYSNKGGKVTIKLYNNHEEQDDTMIVTNPISVKA